MKYVTTTLSLIWPGFSGIVRYGLWSQLGIALCFGGLCQGVLTLNFLWCDFLSTFFKTTLYVFLFTSWIFLNVVASTKLKRYEKMRKSDSKGETFQEAQIYYLKGLWFETECCLRGILKRNPFDAEALLMLATLYRHVKRFDEAKRTLTELEKLDASHDWLYEIAQEKRAVREEETRGVQEAPELKEEVSSEESQESLEEVTTEEEGPTIIHAEVKFSTPENTKGYASRRRAA